MITRTAKLAAVFGLTLLTLSAAAGFAHHDGAPGLRRARPNPWLAIGAALIGGLLDNTHRTPPVGCPGGNPGYPPNQQQQGWGGYGKQGQNQQQQGGWYW